MDLTQRQQRAIVGVVVVVLAIALGSVIAVALDVGPFDEQAPTNGGVGQSDEADTPPPTGTVYTRTAGNGGNVSQQPAFAFDITKIEKCGQTCRDVTVELQNNQNQTARNVTVYTRIYAGNNTNQESQVWEGEEFVGTMNANESITQTQRVDLTTQEGFSVKQKDGWITIITTIRSDDVTITFKKRRDVA